MGLVTLNFDLLTLKLVSESHQRWGIFLPNLGTLGLWVLLLYAMDGRTDGRTKAGPKIVCFLTQSVQLTLSSVQLTLLECVM